MKKVAEANEVAKKKNSFKSNQNTNPRILNILTNYPDSLLLSKSAPTWTDIQNGTTGSNNILWEDVAKCFNDVNYCSGGLIAQHEQFLCFKVNPEELNENQIESKQVCTYFFELKKLYATCYKNFRKSGHHNNHEFRLYCFRRVDVLYMHLLALKHN